MRKTVGDVIDEINLDRFRQETLRQSRKGLCDRCGERGTAIPVGEKVKILGYCRVGKPGSTCSTAICGDFDEALEQWIELTQESQP